MIDRLRNRKIGDAGLDHGEAVLEIDGADALELGHAEQHAVAQRQGAAGQRRSGPARYQLDAFAMAIGEHRRNLRSGLRQHHHHRQRPIGGEPVALVRPHGLFGCDHALAGYQALECRDDFGAACEHCVIGLGHCDGHSFVPAIWASIECIITTKPSDGVAAMPCASLALTP
jgi:hypothetical protein